jgi:hypothetical protein
VLGVDSTSVGDVVLGYSVLRELPERAYDIPVSGSTPKRSAICAILSGRKVPSVSVVSVSGRISP